ncbi:hypothetical protein C6380_09430 [Pseudomonas syringae pv. actinidiae]|nr:hypothetical protein BUE61_17775 [Pseudomonas syringae pv. actinidiae]PPS31126.1 hypothetical protein BVY10_10120 [Pseudomonas amygdali pv. morsprunorum]PBK52559.1 hypothetical protein BUE60_15570 [Pseudomonas syringae pv. actinidiae]RJX58152.1 hypothetical protein C6380_09430 [Pseudomonas syringae pv. actinidiae]RJX60945.1 hypothetical protein C6379_05510 [Pseudomonas syringae pv. actinidiae]
MPPRLYHFPRFPISPPGLARRCFLAFSQPSGVPMASSEDEATTKTVSVYIRAVRVEALNKAAIRVSYETNSSRQISPSELARYLIDNYLEQAVKELIAESARK